MKILNFQSKILSRIALVAVTLGLVLGGSLLQSNVLKVNAAVNVLLVSNTAIPYGNVFPGENLDKTYTVQLDTSVNSATYATTLAPVSGSQNLCPFLLVSNIDAPAEPDTLASAILTRPSDTLDNWQVRLTVPGIKGQISQNHLGGIVVTGGSFACQITVSTNTTPPQGGTISGMKFNDLNRSKTKNTGEPGLSGWTITLRNKSNGIILTTITGADGTYSFTNLPAGTYKIRETHQKGWKRTTKNPKPIVIVTGSNFTNVDFGNAKKQKQEQEDTVTDDLRDE